MQRRQDQEQDGEDQEGCNAQPRERDRRGGRGKNSRRRRGFDRHLRQSLRPAVRPIKQDPPAGAKLELAADQSVFTLTPTTLSHCLVMVSLALPCCSRVGNRAL